MPHQCVHCNKTYPDASKELLTGCGQCGSRFFYYLKKMPEQNRMHIPIELSNMDKKQVEKDVRDMIGAEDEEVPVVLDLESINISSPGKFEIDVVNLFDKKRPLIYKLEEGKYVIDFGSTLKVDMEEVNKKIRKPERTKKEKVNIETKTIEVKNS